MFYTGCVYLVKDVAESLGVVVFLTNCVFFSQEFDYDFVFSTHLIVYCRLLSA